MASFDYSTLWEAFASGEGWDQGEIGQSTEYGGRTVEFYNQIIGPAFGQEDIEGQAFGDVWEGEMASFDIKTMERAEEEFRMAIGDPYARSDDPFGWEKVSRYSAEGGLESDAQKILEGGLYGQGEYLGGTSGADYATSTAKTKEEYTTGLSSQREGITYGGLTSEVGLLSGTGGSVLRSGTGEAQAEDVLAEAYKKTFSLGEEFTEGKEVTETSLKENLNTAFKTYIDAVDDEKARWYDNIMSQVTTLKGIDDTAFGGELEEFASSQEGWGTGLTFDEEGDYTAFRTDDPDTPDIDESRVCGIGELFDKTSGTCKPIDDLGLTYDEFGNVEHETMGCTDPSAENYNPIAIIDNGTCTYDDGETTNVDDDGETGGLDCYTDSDCGPCDRCDAGGCLPWPEAYAPPGCGSGEFEWDIYTPDTTCPEGQRWHSTGAMGAGYCVDEGECVCPGGMPYDLCHSPDGPCPHPDGDDGGGGAGPADPTGTTDKQGTTPGGGF